MPCPKCQSLDEALASAKERLDAASRPAVLLRGTRPPFVTAAELIEQHEAKQYFEKVKVERLIHIEACTHQAQTSGLQ